MDLDIFHEFGFGIAKLSGFGLVASLVSASGIAPKV
jgi:hypothetical protein